MPIDTRRITGPETSQTPYSFCKEPEKKALLDENQERWDGRSHDQMRPTFLRAGVISQAKGSAYIELNKTKVICAVYGPREITRREEFSMKGQLTCEFKFATFSCQLRRQHQPDNQEKDLSIQLLEALEPAVCLHKFPKAQVNVYATVLENDGSALAAAITCASVALAYAGIEMYDLVLSASLRLAGDIVLLDPSENEEFKPQMDLQVNNGSLTVGYMPSLNQISALTSSGECQLDVLTKAIKLCIENCQKVYPVIQHCLMKSKNLEE
ncbi:MTR3 [Acanthosepion pharaonis]|uniref:Exosome complex component MTR3 n=1 Tax=Acanthosepion pharaonis TaxID=158019 RepID=A0A812AJN3_ACAPH|nr:MTR3 [Sepia pharaonis]